MSYATPEDLIARKSPETIADLVSDTDTPVDIVDLETDEKVQAALDSASGAVEAALFQGGRYSRDDLENISNLTYANGIPGPRAYLVHLVCEVAMAFLFARKPNYNSDQYAAALELQTKYLDRLRKGEAVFGIPTSSSETDDRNIVAGAPTFSAPSIAETQSLGLIRDRTLRYYPVRRNG